MIESSYILGFDDLLGRRYLAPAAGVGNLIRTRDPLHARKWGTAREVRFFIEQLPDKVKEQLYERPLLVIPVVALTAEPVDTVILVRPVEEVAETEESEKAIQQRLL